MIVTILKVELLSDKSIPTPNPSLILTANHDLLKVRKGGGKSKKKTKHNLTRIVFHFPHAAPLPYTLTASSVKASANKSFYI